MKDVKFIEVTLDTTGKSAHKGAANVEEIEKALVKKYPTHKFQSSTVLGTSELGVRLFIVLVED